MLTDTREAALGWPRADLSLAVCSQCGFISNVAFRRDLVQYAAASEDQQTHSPTFGRFAVELAGKLVERYGLRGKHVLEIGCGKADFLHLICEIGNNTGTGIDPAINPSRLHESIAERIRLIPQNFSAEHVNANVD